MNLVGDCANMLPRNSPMGGSLTFETGVLMCLFWVGKIVSSLKFQGPKRAHFGV